MALLVLKLFAPSAAASCCVDLTESVHVRMSCCSESCELRAPDTAGGTDQIAAVVGPDGFRISPAIKTGIAAFQQTSLFVPAPESSHSPFSSPPVFLLDGQFRI